MRPQDLNNFKEWFSGYCKDFYSDDEYDQRNIHLKEVHTHNVCVNITAIAKEVVSNENDMLLADSIALFHDVGRFLQYKRYKTFNDSISVNHGLLGADILVENKVLHNLPPDEQDLIIQSIKFHNAFRLPVIEDDKVVLFLKLIRDADKIDIFRVFIEYYKNPVDKKASAAGLGLPDTLGYSKEILSCIHSGKVVSLGDVKNLNDLKLLQLSWLYDINFPASFRIILQRDYINEIASTLPDDPEIRDVVSLFHTFVKDRMKR